MHNMHARAGRVVVHGGLAQDKSVVGAAAVLEIEVAAPASHPAAAPSLSDSAASSQPDLISFDDEPAAAASPPQDPSGSPTPTTGSPTPSATHGQSAAYHCLSIPLSDTMQSFDWPRAHTAEYLYACATHGAQKLVHACSRRGARFTCSRADP